MVDEEYEHVVAWEDRLTGEKVFQIIRTGSLYAMLAATMVPREPLRAVICCHTLLLSGPIQLPKTIIRVEI